MYGLQNKYIFVQYDRNKDGLLNIHELKEIIASREYEHDIPDEVVDKILAMSDTDRNGHLDYQEFVRMIQNPILESIFGHFVHRYIHYIIPRRNRGGKLIFECAFFYLKVHYFFLWD